MQLTRHIPTAVLALLGLGASLGAWRLARDYEQVHADAARSESFSQASASLFLALEREMSAQLGVVHGLASFYASSQLVDRGEFETFTRAALQRHQGIVSLLWAPRVDGGSRQVAIERARQVGVVIPASALQGLSDGQPQVGGAHQTSFPVVLCEPALARAQLLGLDLSHQDRDRVILQQAADSGRVHVTDPRQVTPEASAGFWSIVPVYAHGRGTDSVTERQSALDGFVVGVYRVDLMAKQALKPIKFLGSGVMSIDLFLYGPQGGSDRSPLFVVGDPDKVIATPPPSLQQALEGVHAVHAISVEDQSWLAVVRPSQATAPVASAVLSFTVLLASLALTGASVVGATILIRRAGVVEQQVAARTAQLTAATADLAGRECHLRAIVTHTVDGIVTLNAAGEIQSANPAALQMFGFRSDELIGRPIGELVPALEAVQHGTETGGLVDAEGRRADGSRFPVEFFAVGLQPHDQHACLVVLRDVAQRKAVERLKDEFISTVSHELRTPLSSMLGALELLHEGVLGELPPQALRMVAIASDSGEHLVRLINDILDIERVGVGRLQLRLEQLDAMGIMETAARANGALADKAGVVLVRALPTGTLWVNGDRDRLLQVLTNLLGNAVKFSPTGGRVMLSLVRRDDHARFSVSDEGPGIDDDFRSRVFSPFSQADGSDTRAVGGTGLGLSIAKAIVEAHDGKIWFDTRPGVGTTFCFELELTDKPGSPALPT